MGRVQWSVLRQVRRLVPSCPKLIFVVAKRGNLAISLCSHGKSAPPPFDVNAAKGQLFNSPIWSS